MRGDPVRQCLRMGCLGEGVAGSAPGSDKKLGRDEFAGFADDIFQAVAAVIDEEFFTTFMSHTHYGRQMLEAVAVQIPVKTASAHGFFRIGLEVFLIQRFQGDMGLGKFGNDAGPVRLLVLATKAWFGGIQGIFKFGVGHFCG